MATGEFKINSDPTDASCTERLQRRRSSTASINGNIFAGAELRCVIGLLGITRQQLEHCMCSVYRLVQCAPFTSYKPSTLCFFSHIASSCDIRLRFVNFQLTLIVIYVIVVRLFLCQI